MTKRKGFLYHVCAITGWAFILLGGAGLFFVVVADGSFEDKLPALLVTGGAVIAGILVAMIAERNIFRAFGTAVDHLFLTFWP